MKKTLLILFFILSLAVSPAFAESSPLVSDNIYHHNYHYNWSDTVKSYLYEENDNLIRVEYKDGAYFAEKYDNDKVNLIYYDMVEYEKKDFYDLIVILLDSVNYVTNPADLEKLFRNSYNNLKDDSLLVFDINSEMKMREIFGSECYVYEYEDIFYTWDNYMEDDLIDMNLNFFVENPDGTYRRIEEYQQERIYGVDYVKTLLEKIGFTDIRIFDEDTLDDVNEETLRVLFSARKAAKWV